MRQPFHPAMPTLHPAAAPRTARIAASAQALRLPCGTW